jgi:hypothetical protein
MNAWQCLKQLKYLLQQRKWTGTSNVVFNANSVIVSANPELHALNHLIVPICIIKPNEATIDPEFKENQRIVERSCSIILITAIGGDAATSENAVMGANRTSGSLKSEGRGLLELEEEVFETINLLTEQSGITMLFSASSSMGVKRVDTGADIWYVSMMEYPFKLFTSTLRKVYPPVSNLIITVPSIGTENDLSWTLPATRYDTYKVIVRKASGTTPPATATAGTGVTLGSLLATSVVDPITFGTTWSYSVFMAYDETHQPTSEAQRYSDPVSGTAYPW